MLAQSRKRESTKSRGRHPPRAGSESVVSSEHLFLWASPGGSVRRACGGPTNNSNNAAGQAGAVARAGASVFSRFFRDFAFSRSADAKPTMTPARRCEARPRAAPFRAFVLSCAQFSRQDPELLLPVGRSAVRPESPDRQRNGDSYPEAGQRIHRVVHLAVDHRHDEQDRGQEQDPAESPVRAP